MLAVLPPRLLMGLLPSVLPWLLQAAGWARRLAWAVCPAASCSSCCCACIWSAPCRLWLLCRSWLLRWHTWMLLLCLELLPQLWSELLLLLLLRLALLPLLGSSRLLGWLCLALLPLLGWLRLVLLPLLRRRLLRPLRLLRLLLQLVAQQLSLQALPLTNLTLQGVQQHIRGCAAGTGHQATRHLAVSHHLFHAEAALRVDCIHHLFRPVRLAEQDLRQLHAAHCRASWRRPSAVARLRLRLAVLLPPLPVQFQLLGCLSQHGLSCAALELPANLPAAGHAATAAATTAVWAGRLGRAAGQPDGVPGIVHGRGNGQMRAGRSALKAGAEDAQVQPGRAAAGAQKDFSRAGKAQDGASVQVGPREAKRGPRGTASGQRVGWAGENRGLEGREDHVIERPTAPPPINMGPSTRRGRSACAAGSVPFPAANHPSLSILAQPAHLE